MTKKQKAGLEDLVALTEKHHSILLENGVNTITQLVDLSPLELKAVLDTTLNRATLILKEAKLNLPPFQVQTGKQILLDNKNKNYISTRCKAIDSLLGGRGLESGAITEIFAQYGTGKSQFAFSSIVSALLGQGPEDRGSVIFIDTEGTCSPERVLQIAKCYEPDLQEEEILQNLKIIKPGTAIEQKAIVRLFLEKEGLGYLDYMKLDSPLKLLVVDSLTGLFRAEFVGRGLLSERQQKLNEHMRDIYTFAVKNKIPALVTNQVMNSPDPFTFGDIPVGGHIVAHASTFRVRLVKKKNNRVAKMEDSSKLPARQVPFKLGVKGVIDIDEDDE